MKDGSVRRLDDAWTRFLAGESLDRPDRLALTAAVSSDDVLHRRLLHDLRLDGALRAAAQSERQAEAFLRGLRDRVAASERDGAATVTATQDSPARFRWRRSARARVAGMALAVGALAGVLWLGRGWWPATPASEQAGGSRVTGASPGAEQVPRPPGPASVWIYEVEGMARLSGGKQEGRAALAGAAVVPGDWLTLGPGARVRVEYDDGTELELSGEAVVTGLGGRPGGGRVFMARGQLRASVPPAGPVPAMEVVTAHAVVTAEACFQVDVSADQTVVEVRRRRASVFAPGARTTIEVTAGHYTRASWDSLAPAATTPGARPRSSPSRR